MSRARLTDEQLADIQSRPRPPRGGTGKRDPNSIASLALEFKVSPSVISYARRRRRPAK